MTLDNPLLSAAMEYPCRCAEIFDGYVGYGGFGCLLCLRRNGATNVVDLYSWQKKLQRTYSWAIPNDEAIAALVKHSPIVEIGAGTGYWANLVTQAGGDVLAYDIAPGKNEWCDVPACYHPVIKSYAAPAALRHPDRALFLCWPPYRALWLARALKAYKGTTVLYVGEGGGGCTGSDAFFDILARDFEEVETVDIPQWAHTHDSMTIHRRRRRR